MMTLFVLCVFWWTIKQKQLKSLKYVKCSDNFGHHCILFFLIYHIVYESFTTTNSCLFIDVRGLFLHYIVLNL